MPSPPDHKLAFPQKRRKVKLGKNHSPIETKPEFIYSGDRYYFIASDICTMQCKAFNFFDFLSLYRCVSAFIRVPIKNFILA
jgi:hypothetical protein